MKYILLGFLALSLLAPASGMAKDAGKMTGPLKALRAPITLDYGVSPRMAVIFNHSSHKGVKCVLCHHMETSDGARYAPCTNEECHSIKGARERDPMSMFMAYHDPATDRSCYGCHKREAAKYPTFRNCRPCHMSPRAAQQMAFGK